MISPNPARIDAAAAEKIPIPFAVPVFGKMFWEAFGFVVVFSVSGLRSVLSDGTTGWGVSFPLIVTFAPVG